mgnify:CR=1 FL=1
MNKSIVVIGSGNVACSLVPALKETGYTILQVFSRSRMSAENLAYKVGASAVTQPEKVMATADIYIYCLKDDALSQLSVMQLPFTQGLHLHTSGTMSMSIFEKLGCHQYGVLYPFMTFTKSRRMPMTNVPIFIEYNGRMAEITLRDMAEAISDSVQTLTEERRKALHIAGVFSNNFTNALLAMAEKTLAEAGLTKKTLEPIMQETLAKFMALGANEAQTGPAVRGDMNIIEEHINRLENDRDAQEVYLAITNYIINKIK